MHVLIVQWNIWRKKTDRNLSKLLLICLKYFRQYFRFFHSKRLNRTCMTTKPPIFNEHLPSIMQIPIEKDFVICFYSCFIWFWKHLTWELSTRFNIFVAYKIKASFSFWKTQTFVNRTLASLNIFYMIRNSVCNKKADDISLEI